MLCYYPNTYTDIVKITLLLLLLFIDSKTCGYMRVDHSLMSTLRQRLLLKTLPGQAGHDHAGLKTAREGKRAGY